MHFARRYALAVVCVCADTVGRSHIFVKAVAFYEHLARFNIKRSSKQLYKPRHGCACQKAMSVISVFIIASNCLLHWLMLSCVHPSEAAVRKPTMSATCSGTTSVMFIPVRCICSSNVQATVVVLRDRDYDLIIRIRIGLHTQARGQQIQCQMDNLFLHHCCLQDSDTADKEIEQADQHQTQ